MDRIERLYMKEVGPFEELSLDFPPKPDGSSLAELHLLTGQNGVGKSTLLYALASCFSNPSLISKRSRGSGAEWATTVGGKTITRGDSLNPDKRRTSWAAFGHSGARQLGNSRIGGIEELRDSPFKNALSFSRGGGDLAMWVASAKSEADHYKANGDSARSEEVVRGIRRVEQAVSRITGTDVEFGLTFKPIEVRFRIEGDSLNFEVLPDGLKSILSWIGDVMMRLERMPWEKEVPVPERPFYLFLDEIDIHLHPAWQRKVLPVTQELFPNAQIFAATHSPFVAASVGEGSIYRFVLAEDGTAQLGECFEARAGRSIDVILEEVFGVSERFDLKTEEKIEKLRELRNKVLGEPDGTEWNEWQDLISELADLGEETRAIATAEERQVKRIRMKKEADSADSRTRGA